MKQDSGKRSRAYRLGRLLLRSESWNYSSCRPYISGFTRPLHRRGIFEPLVALEDAVARGQPLGRLHDPRHPDRAPLAIEASRPGTIICHRPLPMTRQGDCLYIIADELVE